MAWHTPQVRDVSPPNSGSTASAIHLCIRNFVGGCGPLGEDYSHPVMAFDPDCCHTSFVSLLSDSLSDSRDWLAFGGNIEAAPPCRRGVAQ
jgi:hypothetical protein